jgi:S-(hydroxymethyl)glutathione dehydrogenase/alcohol dehydrogenase
MREKMTAEKLPIAEMKAAILVESRSPLLVDTVCLPERLRYGQVFVKILYSTICGSQLGEIDANKGEDKYLPHLLGHEASAEVILCGEGVRQVKKGDLAVLHWRKGLGIESPTPEYTWQGKKLNAGWVTTFSEYAIVSENRVTRVAPDNDPRLLPLLGCAVTTGLGVISNNAKIRPGESLVIFGAGGVGLNEIQGAALSGAHPVIGVDLVDARLELARSMGATHIINSAREDAPARIREILAEFGQNQGADVCIDNTGRSEIISLAYELCSPQGRMVCVGVPKSGDKASLYTLPLHFGKVITGSHGGETIPHEDIPRYLRLAKAGKLRLDSLITEMYPLDEINTALERMRSGQAVGRCCLDCR